MSSLIRTMVVPLVVTGSAVALCSTAAHAYEIPPGAMTGIGGEPAIVTAATAPASPAPITVPLVSRLQLPVGLDADHPLFPVLRKTWAGQFGEQPGWKLSLLVSGLRMQPRTSRLTAYSSNCPDGGGSRTRWGTRVRRGICAADARYWGPGSVIWVDEPVSSVLIVEDTGSAVRGRDRFDVSFASDAAACRRFGVRSATYVPLYVAPPRRNWGTKPSNWVPPAPPIEQVLLAAPPVDPVVAITEHGLG